MAARTSEAAVLEATGHGREVWFARLDAWGASGRPHREIAAWIMSEHGVDNWWAQTLTVDYEQARGLRPPGGRRDGTFAVSASITVEAPVERLFAACLNPKIRARWLPGAVMRERTSIPGRSARFDWEDGSTRVNFGFNAKGQGKSQIALLHERLSDPKAAAAVQAYWRERLAALKVLLEGGARRHAKKA